MNKRELQKAFVEAIRVPYRRGDVVLLRVNTTNPTYRAGDQLTIVDPDYDVLLGDPLLLATGNRGDIAVTVGMIDPA